MSGYLLLAGGAEFGGAMAAADRRAIELAGGPDAPIRIIPTAAAPDKNHIRAGTNGVRWFRSIGARDVSSVHLIDTRSAADPAVSAVLRTAGMIYMLGGFPGYLGETLRASKAWNAVLTAWSAGAVLAGSSAGAMVLCERYFDPYRNELLEGMGLVKNVCVLPHHNRFGADWAARLGTQLPGFTLLGIDEATAVINDGPGGSWRIYGPGVATIYRDGVVATYPEGNSEQLMLP